MSSPLLALIVAYAHNRIIGNAGDLPWHEPEDLKHFKRTTLGHAIIHGRKSYQSFGKPLPKRRNIIVTRDLSFVAAGCEIVHDIETAIHLAHETDEMPFICGGSEIYQAAMSQTTHCYLTEIDKSVIGDTVFPAIDESQFIETERTTIDHLTYRTLVRKDVLTDSQTAPS